jgi:hypothetical protein
MKRTFALCLLFVSATASAVITRHDVDDAKYQIQASTFPALADMPGEGHGVLIAPQWVVTAAHAAPMVMEGMDTEILIAGKPRKVKRVVIYPGYQRLPEQLANEAVASGDLSKLSAFLAASNDIALIELASPVTDVTPVPLYRGDQETGMTAELLGKGATGHGDKGQDPKSPHRTVLRHAFNTIEGADNRYVWYRFDAPPTALPLEGITGSGDSGGPLVTGQGSSTQLIGLASWSRYPKDHPFWKQWTPKKPFVEGLYGVVVYAVRISRYVPWMEGVMDARERQL